MPDETPPRPMYWRLARNLMVAYNAYRLGNRMATEDRREDYEPDEFWLALAKDLDDARMRIVSRAFPRPEENKIQ